MKMNFKEPDFSSGKQIELRYENDVICLYGTKKGLETLIDFCRDLIEKPNQGHIHLENNDVLTKESLSGVIAIFDNK